MAPARPAADTGAPLSSRAGLAMLARRLRPAALFLLPVLLLHPLAGLSGPAGGSAAPLAPVPSPESLAGGSAPAGKGLLEARRRSGASGASGVSSSPPVVSSSPSSAFSASSVSVSAASSSSFSSAAPVSASSSASSAAASAASGVGGGVGAPDTPTERLVRGAEAPETEWETEAQGAEEAREWLRARGAARAERAVGRTLEMTLVPAIDEALGRLSGGAPVRVDSTLAYDIREGAVQGGMEAFVPFSRTERSTWFVQPGFLLWSGAGGQRRHDLGVGIGRRALVGEAALGGAVFWDYNVDGGHQRLGLSVDVQAERLYGAVNAYMPLSGWRAGRRGAEIRYRERALGGLEMRLHYAATERLELFGSGSLWRRYKQETGRRTGWRLGGSAGLSYRLFPGLFPGLALSGRYEWVEGAGVRNRYSAWLDWTVPAAAGNPFHHVVDLYRPVERERRVLYAEQAAEAAAARCAVEVVVSHNRQGQTAVLGEIDTVLFTAELREAPVGCAGLPGRFAVRSSAPPVELVFRDVDGDGVYQGAETRVEQSWAVPVAAADLPRAWYDAAREGLVFVFAAAVPVRVQAGPAGDAALLLALSLPLGPGGVPVELPESVAFGADARGGVPYIRMLAETAGQVEVPVTVSALPAAPATFAVTAAGAAQGGGVDYTLVTPSLTFAPGGEATGHVTLALVDDTAEELDEELFLTLRAMDDYGVRNMARLTIVSEDADPAGMPVLGFSRTAQRVSEGEALVLTVQLSRALAAPSEVSVAVTPDTAASNDYTAPPGTLALAAGATRFTLTLATVEDAAVEGDETLTVTLTAVGSAPYSLARDSIALIITDDEQPAIAFGAAADVTAPFVETVAESAGEVVAPVAVSHLPAAAAVFTLVVGGSAVQGADYTLSAAQLRFAPGDVLRKNITITLTDDAEAEDAETITLALMQGAVGSVQAEYARGNRAMITIAANDPVLQFSAPAVSVAEGAGVQLTVQLSSALSEPGAVTLAVSGAAAGDDYAPLPETLALAAGETEFVINLATRQDGMVEGDETLTLTLTAAPGAPWTLGPQAAIEVTIIDDDTPGVTVDTDLALDGAQQTALAVAEGAEVRYTVVLNSQPGHAVMVTPASGAPAVTAPGPLTFTPSNWNTAQTVLVRGAEDGNTANETVTVSHSAASADVNYRGITIADVVVSVTDNDTTGVTVDTDVVTGGVQSAALSVTEGAEVRYTVALDSEPSGNVVITPTSSLPAAATVSGALTFTPANWSTAQTVVVSAVEDDSDFADAAVTVRHGAASPDTDYNGIVIAPVSVNVTDNDLPTLAFTAASVTVAEGEAATVTLRLNSALTQASRVNLEVRPGSAGRNDYAPLPATLALAAGQTDFTIDLAARQDGVVEADETLTVTLSPVSPAPYMLGAQRSVEVTITSDDTAGVVVDTDPDMDGAQTALAASEGARVRYTVALTSQPVAAVMVTPMSDDNTALLAGGALTFTPANWSTAQTVELRGVEDGDGVSETVTVSHTASSRDTIYDGITIAEVMVSVSDNDQPTLEFTRAAARVAEGGTVTLSLALNPVLAAVSSVNVAVQTGGSNSAENGDFAPPGSAALNLAAGAGNFTVTLETIEDAVVEGDETLTVALGIPTGVTSYTLGARSSIEVTITDNEMPTIAFGAIAGAAMNHVATVAEADGAVEVPVTISALPETDTAFSWMVSGSASEGADYAAITSKSINFPAAGAATQTITITLTDDNDAEPDETLTLTFMAPGSGLEAEYSRSNLAILTITSEDLPTLEFNAAAARVNEGSAVTLTLRLSGPLGAASSVNVAVDVSGGNTAEMADFSPLAPVLALAQNASTATVTLAATPDTDMEGDETLTVTLSIPAGVAAYTLGAQGSIVVTISDGPGIVLSPTSLEVQEGGSAAWSVRLRTRPPGSAVDVTVRSADTAAAAIRPQVGSRQADGSVVLRFLPHLWNREQTVIVTGVQDGDGRNEMVTINHRAAQGGSTPVYQGVTAALPVMVHDDEFPTLQFSAETALVAEAAGAVTLTVEVVNGPLPATSVQVMGSDGTATGTGSMADYTTPANLSLARGAVSVPLTVAIAPDSRMEGRETFTVSLAAIPGAPYNLGRQSSIEVTITDLAELAFSAASASVAEGDAVTLTMRLNGPLATASSVSVTATPGTAETADFMPLAATLPLARGETIFRLRLATVEDADVEGDETLVVTLAPVSSAPYTLGAQRSIAVTITDDDRAGPRIVVEPFTLELTEGGAQVNYNVRLGTAISSGTVVVTICPSDTEVLAIALFADPDGCRRLVFSSRNWRDGFRVTVRALEDPDRDNERVNLLHSSVSGINRGYRNLMGPGMPVTILDNDRPVLRFSAARASIAEGAGAATLTVQIANNTLSAPGSVRLAARAGTATGAGPMADYTAPASTLLLASGASSATFTVAIAEDAQVEGPETFTVSLAAVSPASYELRDQDSIEVTITDNEAPAIAFGNDAAAAANYTATVAEDVSGGELTVPITVNALPAERATFTVEAVPFVSSAAPGDDYSLGAGAVSFTPDGAATRNFILTLNDDSDLEGEESLVLRIAVANNPADDLGDLYARSNRAALAITDDEAAATTLLSFSQSEASVLEGDTLTLTVQLSRPLSAASSVLVSAAPGTASADDYTAPGASLALPPNTSRVTFSLDTAADRVDENNEFLTVSLAAVAGSPPYALGTQDSIMVVINDDDTEGFTADTDPDASGPQTALTVREGGTAAYTFALTSDPGNRTVRVIASVNGAGGEINAGATNIQGNLVFARSVTMTFSPGVRSRTITVRGLQDADDTDASFIIRHVSIGYARGVLFDVQVTVDDDDDEPGFLLSRDALRVVEGGDASRYTLRVRSRPAASVTVTPVSSESSAATVSGALTFTAANWTSAQTVTVTPADDSDEVSETVTISHTVVTTDPDYRALAAPSVRVAVIDDDPDPGIVLSAAPPLVAPEGGRVSYTMRLASPPPSTVRVVLTIVGGGPRGRLSFARGTNVRAFAPSSWANPQTITVVADQDANDVDEAFTLNHFTTAPMYMAPLVRLGGVVEDDD